jgi:16S rRNA processing protein RimM
MGFIPVGKVLATRGLQGEVRFRYYNDSGSNLDSYEVLYADRGGEKFPLRLARVRAQSGQFLIRFVEIAGAGEASSLVGQELFAREEDLPALNENEYYDYQLVGLEVVNEKGERVGRVKRVMHTRASDILVVEGAQESLIPMVEGFILDVDIRASRMKVAEGAIVE